MDLIAADRNCKVLTRDESGLLRTRFEVRPWNTMGASTRSKLVPAAFRRKGYRRFMEAAGRGVQLSFFNC